MTFIKNIINNEGTVSIYKYTGEDLVEKKQSDIEIIDSNSDRIRICFVDTETTGLNINKDQIIEIGLKCIELNKKTGSDIKVIDYYESLNDPGTPIPEKATMINGITDEDVNGKSIDWIKVENILNKSQLVIAHNAGFDRPFIDKKTPLSQKKIWACSINDIDWAERGFTNKKQELLCIWHGFYYASHRAMMDVNALIHLITNDCYNENKPIVELINNARKSYCKVFAYHATIEYKDILKENEYRWDPDKRVWHKTIENKDIDDERNWLSDNVYNGNFTGKIIEVTPIDKYKKN